MSQCPFKWSSLVPCPQPPPTCSLGSVGSLPCGWLLLTRALPDSCRTSAPRASPRAAWAAPSTGRRGVCPPSPSAACLAGRQQAASHPASGDPGALRHAQLLPSPASGASAGIRLGHSSLAAPPPDACAGTGLGG